MQKSLWIAMLFAVSAPAMAADCIYYKDSNRVGDRVDQTAPAQTYELTGGFNDIITSVWVRDGYYSLLTQDRYFVGTKVYLYGSGMSFAVNSWQFDKGTAADGGVWYNLMPFAFNDLATSILCLKH